MAHIIDTLIEEEMRSSYIDYAMSVIVGRALPDVKDGLKPVQRRILFAMRELGLLPNRPFRKSATVVGEVIGKFHPHGDMAVYDALVRMAQDFSLRYPLIEGQGNFGSIDGDPPAAYRYTEVRLDKLAVELMEGLNEDTVDFVPNFDGRLLEPTVFPAKIPNLLINGSSGIAVGMATNIPPHNLGEVIDALVLLIDEPDVEDDKLIQRVKGPDFPTGGIIVGSKGIFDAYRTGRGKVLLRSKIQIEDRRGKKAIVVSEIPYQVSKSLIIEKIAGLVREKKIEGISDLRDESDREGLRIVIELKRGVQEQVILNQLLKHTPLQVIYGIILLALVDGEPKVLTLKEILGEYLKHRENVVERRTKFRLSQAEKRAHILEGFRKALDHIDEIVALIKSSRNSNEAKKKLMEKFDFSEEQAQGILDMRLHQLTRLERSKIDEEYEKLIKDIERFRAILANRNLLLQVIKEELLEIKSKYADPRRTEIIEEEPVEPDIEDLIPKEDVVVTLTFRGYIKRTPVRSYRQQARGGVGKSGIQVYEDDFPTHVVTSNTHCYLMLFTNRGRAYILKTYQIPEGALLSKGRILKNLISLKGDEHITALIPFEKFSDKVDVLLATKRGIIKKTNLAEFLHTGKRGIQAIKLREEDELIGVEFIKGGEELILAKSSGIAIRFKEEDVRRMHRQASGVKGIKLRGDECVVGLVKIANDGKILTITERGYGKRIEPDTIRLTKRGGLGIRIQKVTEKTGKLVKVGRVTEEDGLIILTKSGTVIRLKANNVKELGRDAQGVRLMRVKEGDEIVDVAIISRGGEE
jgi:DNA gyrase subunit A